MWGIDPKNTNKYGVRQFIVNILVSTQVNVDGFLKKNLKCNIQNYLFLFSCIAFELVMLN